MRFVQKQKLFSLIMMGVLSASSLSKAEEAVRSDSAPLRSSERVIYTAKASGWSGFMAPKAYVGVFVREDSRASDLRQIEVHEMKPVEQIQVDEALCKKGAETILGPIDGVPWTPGKIDFYVGRAGKICEYQVLDKSEGATFKERRISVFFVHGAPQMLLAKFMKPADAGEVEELRTFIKSLSEAPK